MAEPGIVLHGRSGWETLYDIAQHYCAVIDCDDAFGFVELLEVKDAPSHLASILLHTFIAREGSTIHAFRSLGVAQSVIHMMIFEYTGMNISLNQRYDAERSAEHAKAVLTGLRRVELERIPGCIAAIPRSMATPWFYLDS